VHAVFHNIGVFFAHLAEVRWEALAIGIGFHCLRLLALSRAWRNAVKAAYADERVPWRTMVGAQLAGVGVNAIVPARGGDVVKLFLARRRIPASSYPTLASTIVLLTLFDSVVAGCLLLWAAVTGRLPGSHLLGRLSSFDFRWFFAHPGTGFTIIGLVALALLLLLLWYAEQIPDFLERLTQGFAILRDKRAYLRRVALFQAVDWSLRLIAIYWFLRAFDLPATVHNAFLVQVSQSLATLLPLSPSGIGTEQAFLVYLLRGEASKTSLLSFSVGMRITLIVTNAVLGFTALFLMLRTFRWRSRVEADPDAETAVTGKEYGSPR
jgi:uncharacterized membrane protein YbhN (UPF0104 family)